MLKPEHLTSISKEKEKLLLSYLNLPHVGCLADMGEQFDPGDDASFEVAAPMRSALKQRRYRNGGSFSSVRDLISVDGFGQKDFEDIDARLGDLSRYGQHAESVWGGPEGERRFFELIENAQKYIHISTYIIGGEIGVRLAKVLAEKVRSGVRVRVLFCASGFVISGSPSGTGFVSRFSELRSFLLNDMYVRKRILRIFDENRVPWLNSSPIGKHWKRRDLRKRGINSEKAYYRAMEKAGLPAEWLEEQVRIDAECSVPFANVDHRKMVIVDGKKAFVGSQNLADSYFYSNELSEDPRVNVRNWQWHDNSTIIEGGSVHKLNALFARRWVLSGGDVFDWSDSFYSPAAKIAGQATIGVITTIPGLIATPLRQNIKGFLKTLVGLQARPISIGKNPIRERMMRLPEWTKNDLYVEHCYPSDAGLIDYWRRVAKGPAEFHMIVPFHYDTKVLGAECDRFYAELQNSGVKIHGYGRAIMHSKIAVMDGWYVVTGSYNMTFRSSRADLENEFFIQCETFGSAVKERMQNDLTECRSFTPSVMDTYRARRSIPVFDAIVRYFLL